MNEHNKPLATPWSQEWKDVLQELDSSADQGISAQEAARRKKKYGPNRLKPEEKQPLWSILLNQLKNYIVAMLAAAALLSFFFHQWLEGISIILVLVLNTVIGFFTELNAVRSMEALRQMSQTTAKVIREGFIKQIASEELVPGDIAVLEGGDLVSADMRLLEASRLQADESSLTGESVPVGKHTEPISRQASLTDRSNMLFNGTFVTSGSGKAIVVSTGMNTELGSIAALTAEAEKEMSPLEVRLNRLAHKLIWITVIIAAVIAVSGILANQEVFLIIETSIALAIAAIPEGLPIVATIALARGMWRMEAHNALINRLSAVETLGSTNVICADKTGTLTENMMQVRRLTLPGRSDNTAELEVRSSGTKDHLFYYEDEEIKPQDQPLLKEILETGVLCNNAQLDPQSPQDLSKAVGDPMETALLAAGSWADINRKQLLEKYPEEKEEAFDPQVMMMATFHRYNDQYRVAVKGAPQAVLNACSKIRTQDEQEQELTSQSREEWKKINDQMAEEGLRVLAAAAKKVDSPEADPYSDLVFLGLFGLYDPPRQDVGRAIASCKEAGIRVIMVTGDQPMTAQSIGKALDISHRGKASVVHGQDLKELDKISQQQRQNLLEASIFARVRPDQKLDLISLHQKNGSVVAMTGDGVNDAPALKKADIGVAMGKRGTQVAREAADMVLKDDAFNSIVIAIEQGRAIFDNIRKFIIFLLSGNLGEILIIALALLLGSPLPLLPLQILYLNMIGDVFPALALAVGKGDPSKMKRPPRDPQEPIMAKRHWYVTCGYGFLIALTVLTAFHLAFARLNLEVEGAVTVSFLTLAFSRLWHVFNMRDPGPSWFRNDITRNPFVWGALVICIMLLIAATYLPGLSLVLGLIEPGSQAWLIILGLSLVPWVVGQTLKSFR